MAEEPTPQVPEVPEDLDALNEDALRGLHAELLARHEALRIEAEGDGITFARVREIRDEITSINASAARLATAITERVEAREELAADPTPVPPVAETPETPPEDPPADPPAEEPAPAEAPAEVPAEAVVAALTAEQIAAQRSPQTPAPERTPAQPARVASIVAPVGSRIFEPGQELDLAEIGAAVQDLARGESYDGKVRVASINAYETDPGLMGEMVGSHQSTNRNDELIHDAVDRWRQQFDRRDDNGARLAAICDPLDVIRPIPSCTQATEPFSDSLPSVPAGRLGWQYTPSMVLADVVAGVDVWDSTDQAAVDVTNTATWKPCVAVSCPTPASVRAEAITACFSFDNVTEMSSPERIRNAMETISAQRARTKTSRLLAIADTLSVHFEASAPYGALDGIVHIILTTLPQGEYPNRLDDAPYIFYAPPGLLEALVIDRSHLANKADFDRGSVIAYIESECAGAGWNVRVIDLEDVETSAQAPFASLPTVGVGNKVALPQLGGTTRPFKARLIAPESALYFSTGEINMGVERSPDLNRQNRAQWFAEEYVGLAKHGCHPWYTLHLTICPNGTRAALTTAYSCPTSAS